jgi:hypothetical protein
MKPSHNSHETSPYNGSTPHILQTLGRIEGTQAAQGEDIQEIKVEQRETRAVLTKLQAKPPWWANDKIYWLLAAIGGLLLLPRDLQELALRLLLK